MHVYLASGGQYGRVLPLDSFEEMFSHNKRMDIRPFNSMSISDTYLIQRYKVAFAGSFERSSFPTSLLLI